MAEKQKLNKSVILLFSLSAMALLFGCAQTPGTDFERQIYEIIKDDNSVRSYFIGYNSVRANCILGDKVIEKLKSRNLDNDSLAYGIGIIKSEYEPCEQGVFSDISYQDNPFEIKNLNGNLYLVAFGDQNIMYFPNIRNGSGSPVFDGRWIKINIQARKIVEYSPFFEYDYLRNSLDGPSQKEFQIVQYWISDDGLVNMAVERVIAQIHDYQEAIKK